MTILNIKIEKIILSARSVRGRRETRAETRRMTYRSAKEHVRILIQALEATGIVGKLITTIRGGGISTTSVFLDDHRSCKNRLTLERYTELVLETRLPWRDNLSSHQNCLCRPRE